MAENNNNVERIKSQDENLMNPRMPRDYPGGNRFALSSTHRFASPHLLWPRSPSQPLSSLSPNTSCMTYAKSCSAPNENQRKKGDLK
jgi:hypothetical protein